MQSSARKFIDCSEFPSESHCTLKISGTESEVLKAAADQEKALRSAMRDDR
jgi:hypothetical protein